MRRNFFGIKRNVVLLGFVSLLNDIAGEAVHPLLPTFLVSVLLAPVWAVGLIEGIADSSSSLMKVAGGWAADRTGRRKPFMVAGYTMPALARGALAFATAWPHVLALRFLDRAGKGLRAAPRDAVIAETQRRLRGRAFGFHRAMDNIGAIIGPLAVLGLLAVVGIREIFLLMLIPGLASVVLLLGIKVRAVRPAPAGLRLALAGLSRPTKAFIAIAGLFAVANFSYVFYLLRAQQLGAGVALSTALYLLFAVAYAGSLIPVGMLSDRFGRKWVIFAGWVLFAVICGVLAVTSHLWVAAAMFMGYGISHAALIVQSAYVADLVPAARRATALGALYTVIGVAALPASLIAGGLWQFVGSGATFAFGVVVALAAAVALAISIPNTKP